VNHSRNKDDAIRSQDPPGQPEPAAGKKGGGWWRPVLLLAVVVAIVALAKVFGVGAEKGHRGPDLRKAVERSG
jgi:hypothetical protein